MAQSFSYDESPASAVWLVANGDQALASGSLIPASGHTLGIANGQLGAVIADNSGTGTKNDFLTAGDTIAVAPRIKLIQGTPSSADISGLTANSARYGHRTYVESNVIDSRYSIAVTGKATAVGFDLMKLKTKL